MSDLLSSIFGGSTSSGLSWKTFLFGGETHGIVGCSSANEGSVSTVADAGSADALSGDLVNVSPDVKPDITDISHLLDIFEITPDTPLDILPDKIEVPPEVGEEVWGVDTYDATDQDDEVETQCIPVEEIPYDYIAQQCTIDLADVDGDDYCLKDYKIENAVLQCSAETGGYGTDCDDKDTNVNPSKIEACNGKDDNCNSQIDESLTLVAYLGPAGTQNKGICKPKIQECKNGSYTTTQLEVLPQSEACNGIDDNCDGKTDENLPAIASYSGDPKTKNIGICSEEVKVCQNGLFVITQAQVLPQDEITCNNVDENCDGKIDQNCGPQDLKPLKVSGNKVISNDGGIVTLKGIALNNLYWENNSQIPEWILKKEDFATMKSWGANVVRYALSYTWFEEDIQPFVYKEKGFQDLEQHLAWAKEYGLYLILDMHRAQGGIQDSGAGDALWLIPQNQARLISLWQKIASKYKDNPNIAAFELLNEPHPPTDQSWQSLASQIAAAIRTIDQKHIIIICNTLITNDNDWSKLPFTPFTIPDDNVIYTAHFYEPGNFTHQGAIWAGVPQGANYPDTVVDFNNNFTYVGGYYNNPGFFKDTAWTFLEGNWAVAPPMAAIGQVAFNSEHEMGKVWIDDVVLEEKGPDNQIKTIQLENSDFSTPLYKDQFPWQNYPFDDKSYYPSFWDFSNVTKVKFDAKEGFSNPGSILLTGCIDQCKVEARLLNNFFPVVPGNSYRLSGYVKGQGLAPLNPQNWDWNMFMINYFKGQTIAWDKNYLKTKLGFYADWAKDKGVPFYIGEFGAIALAPSDNDLAYVEDALKTLKEFDMHWTYYALRGNLPYPLLIELISGSPENPNQYVRQKMVDLLSGYSAN